MAQAQHPPFAPIVCIVDFHHARGPEVERWIGVEDGTDPAVENEWPLLPFMALSDGAHTSTEDFSYFTLRHECTPDRPATSLFGISCTRQLDAAALLHRPPEVTRSTVQKAVVVISDSPQHFGHLREKLSVVTTAWFAQCDFTDLDILHRFQESLAKTFKDREHERDQYFGLGLRELVHEYKEKTLVLFKCCLLQPKMLFFGSHCERLCLLQFSLISLIPGLIRKLQDSADPAFNSYEEGLVRPTSLKTSERASLLAYMGLPLQIFGKGSLFGPYTPLQQLDLLADRDTRSYIVGSTNSLLLQQKDRYSDILINLDEDSITISSEPLRRALVLSTPDRRWIDFLTQAVNDTWDPANPSRPITLGYAGSEEFIRLQFEEYLLALLSCTKYRLYMQSQSHSQSTNLAATNGNKTPTSPAPLISDPIDGTDPAADFNPDFLAAWSRTENFRIFNNIADAHLFDIVVPEHPCTGGLTIEDVQRRLNAQVEALHLDERFSAGRESVRKGIEGGRERVGQVFGRVWADFEALREERRRKEEEERREREAREKEDAASIGPKSPVIGDGEKQSAGQRASAYFSSWGQWASEKRKGWGKQGQGQGQGTPPVRSPEAPRSPVERKLSLETAGGYSLDEEEVRKDATVGGYSDDGKAESEDGTEGLDEGVAKKVEVPALEAEVPAQVEVPVRNLDDAPTSTPKPTPAEPEHEHEPEHAHSVDVKDEVKDEVEPDTSSTRSLKSPTTMTAEESEVHASHEIWKA